MALPAVSELKTCGVEQSFPWSIAGSQASWFQVQSSLTGSLCHTAQFAAVAAAGGSHPKANCESAAEAAGPGSAFVGAPVGHGYELLVDPVGDPTEIAGRVLAWIAG